MCQRALWKAPTCVVTPDLCAAPQAFWGVVNNITPVEQLEERSGYHLMREGVVPTWEGNARGGYWSMMCPKSRTVRLEHAHPRTCHSTIGHMHVT